LTRTAHLLWQRFGQHVAPAIIATFAL
jgi:hypothetical protein